VVFINGEPQPEEYRQFNIRTKLGGDPQAMEEAILRRLNHKEWLYPQLILVDGGKTQVAAAFKALKNKNLIGQIGFLGLAKKEEKIVIPIIRKGEIKNWKIIGPSCKSLGFLLLQRARDEAHRFAQRYYKKLYQKATFSFGRE
jgi:excinuclease ABC subunit C